MIVQICFVVNKKKERKKSVSLLFILYYYLNEVDVYICIFVVEKFFMDKEIVFGLRKNNGDVFNCCGLFFGCYSFQIFFGFLVICLLCLYLSIFKLYNDIFFLK